MNQSNNINSLAEMFPNIDIETITLIYNECGSFDRAMERLLQGDPSTMWRTSKSRSQNHNHQVPQQQDNYRQNFSNFTYNHNSAIYQHPQQNFYYQQQQQTQQQHRVFSPQYIPHQVVQEQQKIIFPTDLTNIKTNHNLFGSINSESAYESQYSDSELSSNSPFSSMPMSLSTERRIRFSDNCKRWNFTDISEPKMRLSKSVDALRQLDN